MTSQAKNPVLSIYCQPLHSTTKHVVHCLLHCDYKNRCRDFVAHYIRHQEVIDAAANVYQGLREKEAKAAMLEEIVAQAPPAAAVAVAARVKPGSRLPVIEKEPAETKRRPGPQPATTPKRRTATSPALNNPTGANTPSGKSTPARQSPPADLRLVEPVAQPVQRQQLVSAGVSNPPKRPARGGTPPPTYQSEAGRTAADRVAETRKEQTVLGEVFIVLESGGKAVIFDDERRVLDHVVKAKRKARYFRATELEVQLQMVPVSNKPKPKKPSAKKKARATATEE